MATAIATAPAPGGGTTIQYDDGTAITAPADATFGVNAWHPNALVQNSALDGLKSAIAQRLQGQAPSLRDIQAGPYAGGGGGYL